MLHEICLFEKREREREERRKKDESGNYAHSDYLLAPVVVHYFVMRVDRSRESEDSPTTSPDVHRA